MSARMTSRELHDRHEDSRNEAARASRIDREVIAWARNAGVPLTSPPRVPEAAQAMSDEVLRLRRELGGAVRLTDAERERVLWWLHRPVPPGPMKTLDEAIIRKLKGGRA